MYNLRYHLASLVAVFFALAVGLLLGTLVAERGMVTEQTGALVADLQSRFDDITATNERLQQGLERDRAFAEAAVGPLTAGALAETRVVVLASPGGADDASAVAEMIAASGAQPVVSVLGTPGMGLDAAEPAGLAGYFEMRGIEMAPPGPDLHRQVAEALVAEWRAGQERTLTDILSTTGLLATESVVGTQTAGGVVVVGSAGTPADTFGVAVARAMQAAGGTALGAEAGPIDGGIAAACEAEGISAIDHLGTPQGRLSLVWILSGRARGYFGSADGADGYFPAL